jgi:hypothetical protein
MEHLDIDAVIEETARDVATEADKIAASEAAKTAQEEPAKESAEEGGKEAGDRTDGIPAAGAPGATPATEPPATDEAVADDQPSTSQAPSTSKYLKVGENLLVNLPGTASIGAPNEGETFDEEIITAAGLEIVNEPSVSSSKSEEDQLLQAMGDNFRKLQALAG